MSAAQVYAQIDEAVRQGGGTQSMASFLKRIAKAESGCDVNAKNPCSTAKGIFQFINSTWQDNGGGNVWDVATQCRNAVTLAKKNEAALIAVLGREPNAGEYYLAHFAGETGAKAVLKASPGTYLRDIPIMRAACESNPTIRNFTAGQLRAWTAGKMGDRVSLSGGGTPDEERESREEFLLRNTSMTHSQIKDTDVMGQLFLALFMSIMSKAFEKPAQEVTAPTIASNEPLPSPRTPTPATSQVAAVVSTRTTQRA